MKKKNGQAAVEIALMMPILVLLLCGITDFGRILFAANNINMVSQEAARYASFNHLNSDVTALAVDNCSLSNKTKKLHIRIQPDDSEAPRKSGTNVTVIISYDVDYITPLMQSIIGKPFTVSTSSTIRVE
ncbi:TadE/TadG family type IV pilus assembly protein [Clostridium sp. JN-9]|uniref:TadE family protein n=1 Tax=Clostridium sp. JN-9 TaxID=2507159 RepID=UPI0013E8BAA6|nr:TadE/TadG family type IV pilus assembly protein [Clostridium sp. JN-9]